MSTLDRWIDNKIIQNLFIWFFLFLILLTTIQTDNNRIIIALFAIALFAPSVYINNLLILPFLRKKTLLFFCLFILNTLVFSIISVFLITIIGDQDFKLAQLVNFFGIMILALTFASAIKLARDSFVRRQQEKEAELKLLKGQLNPHFLFNTLNNLYGLSVIKSNNLPSLMLKLSDLLRYSLYETKEALVPLEKEITYLENYIALEKIRLEESTDIQFKNNVDLGGKKIAPMLFIVFVENAFKHLGTVPNQKSSVVVTVEEKENKLIFECINTVGTLAAKDETVAKDASGIGLKNVKKRLQLIYPEKHSLTFNNNKETFGVELILEL
ncbi:sensor histidine kinase [Aquimarina rhabdastrellae]